MLQKLILLTCLLTPWSPAWKANWFSASEEIPCILWNPKVHYRIYESSPSVHILSQISPVHAPHPTSWRSILIFSSYMPGSSKWSLSLMFAHQNPVYASPLPHTSYMLSLSPLITTILVEAYRSISFSLFSFHHYPVTSSLLGSNILLSTLFSNILSLHSFLSLSNKASYP
jgi:hypothetical protein